MASVPTTKKLQLPFGSTHNTPEAVGARLAAAARTDGDGGCMREGDRYGDGAALQAFEAEVAALLGTEAAVFCPSGTMAQQIALATHAGLADATADAPRPILICHPSRWRTCGRDDVSHQDWLP